jgi:hypothetical protein
MVKNSQALKPKTFISQLPTVKEKEVTTEDLSEEETQLASLSRTAGWKVLTEYIEQLKRDMDALNNRAIEGGADFEAIGQNTLIISQAKQVIDKVLNRVADAREASDSKKK